MDIRYRHTHTHQLKKKKKRRNNWKLFQGRRKINESEFWLERVPEAGTATAGLGPLL